MNTPRLIGRNLLTSSSKDVPREDEEPAVAIEYTYTCPNGHKTVVPLWESAEIPETWKCRVCSRFAALPGVEGAETGQWRPAHVQAFEPKSHIDQLHERRTIAELEALLEERLAILRARRGEAAA